MQDLGLCKVQVIAWAKPKLMPAVDKSGAGKQILRIMKLTAIIILAACLQVSAKGYSQKITLSVKDAPLEQVFKSIEKQSGFYFNYVHEMIKKAQPVTMHVKDVSLEEVLAWCFKGQPLDYTVVSGDKLVIIKERKQVAFAEAEKQDQKPPIDVSGKVTDDEGRPLAGANVKVKGTTVGVTTDMNGSFLLRNVSENAVLEISYVGFEMKTFTVRGSGVVNIALAQKLSTLDETVVIAYGTSSRRFATGNIATVKAADIEKLPIQNPLLALQGRVPGIEVNQLTGVPGGGVTVRIQGRNSIRSGLDPLVVIDGVPFFTQLTGSGDLEYGIVQGGSPLNYINPADIESIDVLKDADATAIYGSRAANGAILITTKKGKPGRARLSFNVKQGWAMVSRKVDMLNTRQYLDMRYEAFRNGGTLWTSPSVSANDLKVWDTTRYTDWQKELIGGKALYTNINAGISGGSTAMQYTLGATYNRQTLVFPGNFDDKVGSVHFNVNTTTPNQRFKVQLSGSYMYDQNHLPGIDLTQNAILMEPNAPPLYNEDGTLNWAPNEAGNSTWTNPLSYTISTDFNNTTKNLVSNANLSYQIIKGLDIRTSLGYTNMQSELYAPARLERLAPENRPNGSIAASFGSRNMSNWIVEPMLQYLNNIGKLKIEALLGTTIQKTSFSYLGISGSEFPADKLMNTLTAAKSVVVTSSTSGINRYNAVFGRLNFIWANKYLLNLTARRDGSNKFGDNNKFNNFGSVGAGWIFSQEKWVNGFLRILSFGKLRGSYGITGNDQISDFSYLSLYNIRNPSVLYQNSIGLIPVNIANPYLQWEETRKWQFGLDIGVFKDRILLGATYARNRSSNQLINYVLPSFTGFQSIVKNLPAVIQNVSWEFTLNTTNVKTKNITWSSNVNLTIPRNKLLSFPGIELTGYASGMDGVVVGQPLGVIKLYKYAGVNPSNGRHLLIDRNGNASINPNLRSTYVSVQSTLYGGLTNRISYKTVQLDVLLQFVKKKAPRDFYWYNNLAYPGVFFAGSSNQPVSVLDRWQKPGDNTVIPPFSTSNYSLTVTTTDAFYSDEASFLRLKNISLSWQLPSAWMKKIYVSNAQLYLSGQNLHVFTKYRGIDPESGASNLPPLQMWTMGLNVEL
jgi:TonB-linked SusC/RagA family outer membrane protein